MALHIEDRLAGIVGMATPGPWEVEGVEAGKKYLTFGREDQAIGMVFGGCCNGITIEEASANADMIIVSRSIVPVLLTVVRAARAVYAAETGAEPLTAAGVLKRRHVLRAALAQLDALDAPQKAEG